MDPTVWYCPQSLEPGWSGLTRTHFPARVLEGTVGAPCRLAVDVDDQEYVVDHVPFASALTPGHYTPEHDVPALAGEHPVTKFLTPDPESAE